MRVLCDHNVAAKYHQTFERAEWLDVSTVAEELSPDAADGEIADLATREGWVVFTTDDDFYAQTVTHGLLVYSQIEDPSPGDVLVAIEAIADAYDTPGEIDEVVPDGWI